MQYDIITRFSIGVANGSKCVFISLDVEFTVLLSFERNLIFPFLVVQTEEEYTT